MTQHETQEAPTQEVACMTGYSSYVISSKNSVATWIKQVNLVQKDNGWEECNQAALPTVKEHVGYIGYCYGVRTHLLRFILYQLSIGQIRGIKNYSIIKISQKVTLKVPSAGYVFPIDTEGSPTIAGKPFNDMIYITRDVEIQPTVIFLWIN